LHDTTPLAIELLLARDVLAAAPAVPDRRIARLPEAARYTA